MRPTRHGIRSNREWPCSLFIVVMWILCSGLASALAQTVTTNITSSGLNTTVTPNGTTTDITGGTRPGNGTNLFHSFGDFSVGNGHTANFQNETNLPTSNILSRVSGGHVSNIFGTLKTTNFGSAALWLINPAGIVFGPTASLNVGGSVHFSTADYLKFSDGAQFFASLNKQSQLTSVPVAAFGFLGPEPPKAIDVRGATLSVPSGKTLSLVGGNMGFTDSETGTTPGGVTITGGTLTAPGGQINLMSVGTPNPPTNMKGGEVPIDAGGNGVGGTPSGFSTMGDLAIINSNIYTSVGTFFPDDFGLVGGILVTGGSVKIQGADLAGKNLTFQNIGTFSLIGIKQQGKEGSGTLVSVRTLLQGENLLFQKIGSLELNGTDGPVQITTGNGNRAFPSFATKGKILFDDIGNFNVIDGREFPLVTTGNKNPDFTNASNATIINHGDNGLIAITSVDALTVWQGNITGTTIRLENIGKVSVTGTSRAGTSGGSGDLNENDLSQVPLINGSISSAGFLHFNRESGVQGQLGNIDVHNVGSLSLDGGLISTATSGNSNAGSITFDGVGSMGVNGVITSNTNGPAKAGTVSFTDVGTLTVGAEGQISSRTKVGSGDGGSLLFEDIGVLTNHGRISASSTSLSADAAAGNITMDKVGLLNVDGGQINSRTLGNGPAGTITLTNVNAVTVQNGGVIRTNTTAPGHAGNITITTTGAGVETFAPTSTQARAAFQQAISEGDVVLNSVTLQSGGRIESKSALAPGDTDEDTPKGEGFDDFRNDPAQLGDAGTITLTTGALSMAGNSLIETSTQGAGAGGGVTVMATESVDLTGGSEISSTSLGTGAAGRLNIVAPLVTMEQSSSLRTSTNGPGNAGDILVDGTTVTIMSGSVLNSSTFESGNAGTVTVKGTESVTIAGIDATTNFKSAVASAAVAGTGAAGTVTIAAPAITIADGGTVSTSNSFFNGQAGDILLDGQQVTISGGGQVTSSTSSEAPGGTVTVKATESIAIRGSDNQGNLSRIATATFLGGGDAGQVSITAPQFTMEGGEITASSLFSGRAGNIDINAHMASLTGGAQVVTESIGDGAGGQITLTLRDSLFVAGADGAGFSTTISSSTDGLGNAGAITLAAPTMTITDGAFVTASVSGAGQAGAVSLQAARLNITNGALVDSSTFGPGQGGEVHITATEAMELAGRNDDGPSQISTITAGSGNAGKIEITTPVLVVEEGAIVANTGAAGAAGNISLETDQLSLTNGALISSRGVQTATGDAGSVTLQVGGLFSSAASTVSSEATQGAGGNVSVTAGDMRLTNGTTISAQSAGSQEAGSIALTSTSDIRMQDSTVTTFAANASGGNIKLTAPDIVLLDNSKITSSVNGPAGSNGGNIGIDPEFVVLANGSQILAQAFGGNGGNINIVTNTFFAEPGTLIDASSQLGISGTITINSPVQNLSGTIAPLPKNFTSLANLYAQRCAGQKGGQFSSFVQGARDALPPQPGEALGSPMLGVVPFLSPAPVSKTGAGIPPRALRPDLPEWSGSPASHLLVFREGCHSS